MIQTLVLKEVSLLVFTPLFNRGGGNIKPTELLLRTLWEHTCIWAFVPYPKISWDSSRKIYFPQKLFCTRNTEFIVFKKKNLIPWDFIHKSIKQLKIVTKFILKFKAPFYRCELYPYPQNMMKDMKTTTKLYVLKVP